MFLLSRLSFLVAMLISVMLEFVHFALLFREVAFFFNFMCYSSFCFFMLLVFYVISIKKKNGIKFNIHTKKKFCTRGDAHIYFLPNKKSQMIHIVGPNFGQLDNGPKWLGPRDYEEAQLRRIRKRSIRGTGDRGAVAEIVEATHYKKRSMQKKDTLKTLERAIPIHRPRFHLVLSLLSYRSHLYSILIHPLYSPLFINKVHLCLLEIDYIVVF